MTVDRNLPALRAIQLTPFEHVDGRLFFELRDMLQIAPRPIAVSGAACFVLAHLDGQHTIADVQRAFREQTGQHLPADEIEHLVAILDSHCFLDTPRFADALAAQAEAYQAAACRDNRDRWPAADELRAAIDAMLCATEVEPIPHLRGIIAPHLDYRRGAPCYAAAYALLRNAGPADRYCHLRGQSLRAIGVGGGDQEGLPNPARTGGYGSGFHPASGGPTGCRPVPV